MIGPTSGDAPLRLLRTITLVSVILPVFLTVPLKVSKPPGTAGLVGQFWVTWMPGRVRSVQVAEALLVTMSAVQLSLPVAITVLLTEQESAGAVKLAVKLADVWAARLGRLSTVMGEAWLSVTITLFKVTLPVLVTVPV